MGITNSDEWYILNLARSLPDATARLATAEEDCGHQKADVVVNYGGIDYYLQVSRQPKSAREQEKLLRRGTHPIHTHSFGDLRIPDEQLVGRLRQILAMEETANAYIRK